MTFRELKAAIQDNGLVAVFENFLSNGWPEVVLKSFTFMIEL